MAGLGELDGGGGTPQSQGSVPAAVDDAGSLSSDRQVQVGMHEDGGGKVPTTTVHHGGRVAEASADGVILHDKSSAAGVHGTVSGPLPNDEHNDAKDASIGKGPDDGENQKIAQVKNPPAGDETSQAGAGVALSIPKDIDAGEEVKGGCSVRGQGPVSGPPATDQQADETTVSAARVQGTVSEPLPNDEPHHARDPSAGKRPQHGDPYVGGEEEKSVHDTAVGKEADDGSLSSDAKAPPVGNGPEDGENEHIVQVTGGDEISEASAGVALSVPKEFDAGGVAGPDKAGCSVRGQGPVLGSPAEDQQADETTVKAAQASERGATSQPMSLAAGKEKAIGCRVSGPGPFPSDEHDDADRSPAVAEGAPLHIDQLMQSELGEVAAGHRHQLVEAKHCVVPIDTGSSKGVESTKWRGDQGSKADWRISIDADPGFSNMRTPRPRHYYKGSSSKSSYYPVDENEMLQEIELSDFEIKRSDSEKRLDSTFPSSPSNCLEDVQCKYHKAS